MFKIVNEDLMSFEPTMVTDKATGRSYFKLKILTSNRMLQRQSDLNTRKWMKPQKLESSSKKKYRVENYTDQIVPVNREVLRISAPYKELSDLMKSKEKFHTTPLEWNKYPMTLNVSSSGRFSTQVDIRCHLHGEDHANIFVIAFPFNGMIKPLKEDPRYRIYKGFISSSIKPFFHSNHKYRKVLYLVIEVNKNLFKDDHKYHTDHIDIELESFALFDDRETGTKKTNREKMTLSITSPNGDYDIAWEYETINDSIFMNVNNVDLWPTFSFDRKNREDRGSELPFIRKRKNNKKFTPKSVVIEGDMMVTTNKHGIRKEIPLNRGRKRETYQDKDRYDYEVPRKQNNHGKNRNNGKNSHRKENWK